MENQVNESAAVKESKPVYYYALLGLAAAAVVIILGGVFLICFRAEKRMADDKFSLGVAKIVGLPAGFVNGKRIMYVDYLSDWQAADKSYKDAALANKPTEAELRQNIWKMLVKNEVVKQEASKNNIVVGVQEINDEYSNLVKTVGSEDQAKQLIENNYNWSIEQFKERIMRPYVLQQKLAASKEMLDKLNKEPEARANEVLRQAQEGKKSFEDLAKEFGEDGTKDKGGDLGWFGKDMMIKEFEDAVASMQVGEIKGLVKTSFGFHLIKLVDKRKNDKKETEWRAEHILIKTGDFDSYLNNLVTKAKVWKWISL